MTDKPFMSFMSQPPRCRVHRTCGGGMRRRVRALCGWAWWKADDKFRRCRKSESDSPQSEYCNTLCAHGTWSAWLGKCRCNDGYRGLCCQTRMYKPMSSRFTVDREYGVMELSTLIMIYLVKTNCTVNGHTYVNK